MPSKIIVRFQEYQSYDINRDAEVVRFMAMTSSGSFWCDAELRGPGTYRRDKAAFREQVVELIRAGASPQYVEIEQEEQ